MNNAGVEEFTQVGGGKLPDPTWGYISATWPFVRIRVGSRGVRFEPAFWRNLILFSIPSWEATWADIASVQQSGAGGMNVTFKPHRGPAWTFYSLGGARAVLAAVHQHQPDATL